MDFNKIYEYRHRTVSPERKFAVWKEISAYIFKLTGSPLKLLDPAAGSCEFFRSLPVTTECWAVDKYAPPVKTHPNIRHLQADIFEVELPENYFDVVFMSNFIEHLPDYEIVGNLFDRMFDALVPGGKMVVLGPNFKYCFKDYYDVADHMLPLSHIAVEELLYACNFQIEKCFPRFIPFSFRSVLPFNRTLVKIYLNTPLVWRIFGAQYLLIAHKPKL